jgi:hypothetical protein
MVSIQRSTPIGQASAVLTWHFRQLRQVGLDAPRLVEHQPLPAVFRIGEGYLSHSAVSVLPMPMRAIWPGQGSDRERA